MKVFITSLLLGLIILFCSEITLAATIYSNGTGGGNWGTPSSWNPTTVPGCGDTIYIIAGDIISVDNDYDYSEPGCMSPTFVIIDSLGTINFSTNGKRLKLACNSGFILEPGGNLVATGTGGGNSTFLEICENTVWKKSDGPRTGPLVFGTPLPIELISFEAHVNDDRVDLKWITATEINNDFFTVEKSNDAKNWEVVAIIIGAGNSNQIIEYFEVDNNPEQGLSYYRLKQTDYDAKYTYSNVIPVNFTGGSGGFNVYPNPVEVGGTVSLDFEDYEEEVLVVLRDVTGKEFYSKLFLDIEKGKLIGIPIEDVIPAGIYLITATSENQIYSKKIIVR